MFDERCNDSTTDEATGIYTDGSNQMMCSAELDNYADCPCYGQLTSDQAAGLLAALGAWVGLVICCAVCIPLCLIGIIICVICKVMKSGEDK